MLDGLKVLASVGGSVAPPTARSAVAGCGLLPAEVAS
jgi:hypothetical protein